jgi:hypothetical protein
MPAALYFSWEEELVVEDPGNQRRSFFNMKGEYLRSESLGPVFMSASSIKTVPGEYIRAGQGAVVMRISTGPGDREEEPPKLVEIVDEEGNVKRKFGERKTHENQMLAMLINRTSVAYAPPDHVVLAFANLNEIHVYNKNTGNLERIITRRLSFSPKEPQMRTRPESSTGPEGGQRVLVRALPDTDPISDDVAVDSEGRIWIITRLTTSEVADEKETESDFTGLVRLEIFSLEGELLTAIPLDFAPGRIFFDQFGDLWLLDVRESLSARRFEVRWP